MKALAAHKYGNYQDVLSLKEIPDISPSLADNQLLIKVAYSEINPVDLQKLNGGAKHSTAVGANNQAFVPGYGGSGIVAQSHSADFLLGTRVIFLLSPRPFFSGSYADYCLADVRAVAKLPPQMTLQHGATLPLAGCTAHQALIKLNIAKRQRLLIVGGAGGVGSWAAILAQCLRPDLDVLVATRTNSTDGQEEVELWCTKLGVGTVVSTQDESFVEAVGGGGPSGSVDAILCLVEPFPKLFAQLSEIIQPYGSICLVVAGASIQNMNCGFCFFKSIELHFETVFSCFRTNFSLYEPRKEMETILELLQTHGRQVPLTPLQYNDDWNNFEDALGILSSGHARGKMVLKIAGEDIEL